MRDINLLPPKQRQKQLALTLVAYTTVGFIVLVLTIAGFAITLTTIQVTINDKISFYQDQTQATNKRSDSFKSLQNDLQLANKSLQQTGTALAAQTHPTNLVKKFSQFTGPDIVFISLAISKPAATSTGAAAKTTASGDQQIVINGTAKDRANVIEFKRALELDPELHDITYTFSTSTNGITTDASQKTTLTFVLNAIYSQGASK